MTLQDFVPLLKPFALPGSHFLCFPLHDLQPARAAASPAWGSLDLYDNYCISIEVSFHTFPIGFNLFDITIFFFHLRGDLSTLMLTVSTCDGKGSFSP